MPFTMSSLIIMKTEKKIMGKIVYITGGARSGKSRFSEKYLKNEKQVLYIATGVPFDEEMKERIKIHQSVRNPDWKLLESYQNLDQIILENHKSIKYILIDCITIMITNLMLLDHNYDWDNISMTEVNKL